MRLAGSVLMARKLVPLKLERSEIRGRGFSLVRGGIVYRLERWVGLIDEKHLGIGKRILIFWCIAWLPIAILELLRFAGSGAAGTSYSLITSGLGVNIRLLFTAAVLIAADAYIENRVAAVIAQFERRQIIDDSGQYSAILSTAHRQIAGATGIVVEAVILVLSVLFAIYGSGSHSVGLLRDWKALAPEAGIPAAVVWYLWVATPLLFFLLLRWGWRFLIWTRTLWEISRLGIKLNASHPDLAGGIAFIAIAQKSFALLSVAVSASGAATVAFRVNSLGMPLESFYSPIGALIATEAFFLLAPMTFFAPRMVLARRNGMLRYGALSSEYVSDFDNKWIRGPRPTDETLLGSSDIEQWANVGIGLERSGKMRPFPSPPDGIVVIILAGALPFVPLLLLQTPVDEILKAALRLLI